MTDLVWNGEQMVDMDASELVAARAECRRVLQERVDTPVCFTDTSNGRLIYAFRNGAWFKVDREKRFPDVFWWVEGKRLTEGSGDAPARTTEARPRHPRDAEGRGDCRGGANARD